MANGDGPPVIADELAELAAELRQTKEATGLSWQKLAQEAGIPEGTLSSIASGSYVVGVASKQPALIRRWLAARKERARVASVIPQAPAFVRTPTAINLLSIFGFAHTLPDIAVIAGEPGTGKTTAACEYVSSTPNAWMVTAEPCTASVNTMLAKICEELGIAERAAARLSQRVQERLRPIEALLIIDEAQHLRVETIDQLRSIHDLARIGLVLMGNLQVSATIDGMAGKPAFVTAKSRIGMRETMSRPKDKDVSAIIAAWGVEDQQERALLAAVGRKPGGLRTLFKTLQLASVLAAGARDGEGEVRGLDHIRAAAGRLGLSAPAVAADAS